MPLPAESVDVVISNCVINLSSDKRKVLEEAFRARSGGRFAVSDVVVSRELPAAVKRSLDLDGLCRGRNARPGLRPRARARRLRGRHGRAHAGLRPTTTPKWPARSRVDGGPSLEETIQARRAVMSAFIRASSPDAVGLAAAPNFLAGRPFIHRSRAFTGPQSTRSSRS